MKNTSILVLLFISLNSYSQNLTFSNLDSTLYTEAPIVKTFAHRSNHSTTNNYTFFGSYFTQNTSVEITNQTVNSVVFVSTHELIVNVTSNSTDGFYDVVFNNGLITTVAASFEVKLSVWVDLRSGGDTFTTGNGAGNDIRHHPTLTVNRDADGMYFSGINPWSSWVKWEYLGWTRGSNTTLEMIVTQPTGFMMFGIGSDATNETSTAQYGQAEVECYFQNATTMWGLYGNNGTPGSIGNQSNPTTLLTGGTYKVKFTNDGAVGSVFTIYRLPSSNQADWDDESNILNTFTVGGTLNPDETNLFPFTTPQNGGTQRFLAIKIQ